MGAWLSSLFHWEFILSPFVSSHRLSLPPTDPYRQDPLLLLSAAAEIAAIHRTMEEHSSARTRGVNIDTDSSESISNDLSSSDNDCPSSEIIRSRQQEIFDDQKKNALRETFCIGDEHVFNSLRNEVELHCGPSTSVLKMKRQLELGGKTRYPTHDNGIIAETEKTNIRNKFFPNCRKVIEKLRTKMFCCQYVKNGSQLVVASQDERIRFYEAAGRRGQYQKLKSYKLMGVGWSILDVALSACGQSLAYATWKDAVVLCRLIEPSVEAPDGITFHNLNIPSTDSAMAVFSVRFSNSGHEVLAGSSDRALHVFDLETQSRVVSIEDAHEDDVNAVCYGDNHSHLLYSGGDDGIVKVWDRRAFTEGDAKPVGIFAGHRDGITYIDSRRDNRFLLSNSKDQTIKLWDLRCFSSEDAANETRRCVAKQSWDYRWQPAPSTLQKIIKGDTSVLTLRGHSVLHTLIRAKFSPSSTGRRYIYTGCARGEVVVYDLLCGKVCRRLPGHVAVVRDTAWNPSNNEIASCGWDGIAALWKWDERRDHGTGQGGWMGEEDSCDEFYNPAPKRKVPVRKCKRRKRNVVEGNTSDELAE